MQHKHRVAIEVLLALATLPPLLGCQPGTETSIGSARAALASNDRAKALIQLKGTLQDSPNHAEGRYLLGKLLLEGGDAAGATVELGRALELGHPKAQVVPPLAQSMTARGEYRRVILDFGSLALDDKAALASLKTTLAEAYFATGEAPRGKQALLEALAVDPENVTAQLLQARRQLVDGDRLAARDTLNRVLQQHPTNGAAWLQQADLLATTAGADNEDQAVAAYRQCLAHGGPSLPAHAGILSILVERPDLPAAQTQLDALRKAWPQHPRTTYFEALLALKAGDLSLARQAAEKLVNSAPAEPVYQRLLGAIALQAGDFAQAEQQLAAALKANPGHRALRQQLALAQLQAGQAAKAVATLAPLVTPGPATADVYTLAGVAALQNSEPAKANALFAAANRLKPEDSRLRTSIAMGRLGGSDATAALGELQSLASQGAGTEATVALIMVRLQRKEYDLALKAIDVLERKDPKGAKAPMLRGQVLAQRGDRPGARASYERAVALAPASFPPHAALAAMDIADGRADAARQRFEGLLVSNPRRSDALIALASIKELTGGSREAVASLLADAVKADPRKVGVRILQIDQMLKHRDGIAAMAAAREALQALPGEVRLIDALGRASMAANDRLLAEKTYIQLVAASPGMPEPLVKLAQAQAAAGNNKGAEASLQRALAARADFAPALVGLAHLYLSTERPRESIAMARKLQSVQPAAATGYALEAEVHVQQKAWGLAEAAYSTALKKTGDASATARSLHAVLSTAGKAADAERLATGWLRDHPRDAGFQLYLGDLAMMRQDFALAETRYKAVLITQPGNAAALNNLAWASHRLGHAGALGFAEQALALRPDHPAYMDTVASLWATDPAKLAKALALQKQAVALAPQVDRLRLTLAKLYVQAGQKAQAGQALQGLDAGKQETGDREQLAELRRLVASN